MKRITLKYSNLNIIRLRNQSSFHLITGLNRDSERIFRRVSERSRDSAHRGRGKGAITGSFARSHGEISTF